MGMPSRRPPGSAEAQEAIARRLNDDGRATSGWGRLSQQRGEIRLAQPVAYEQARAARR